MKAKTNKAISTAKKNSIFKSLLFKFILTFVMSLFLNQAKAQYIQCPAQGCQGTLACIDIDYYNQNFDNTYIIPVPPEGLPLNYYSCVSGIGNPHLENSLGNTVELHLGRIRYIPHDEYENTVLFYLDLTTDLYDPSLGLNDLDETCRHHYHIELIVHL